MNANFKIKLKFLFLVFLIIMVITACNEESPGEEPDNGENEEVEEEQGETEPDYGGTMQLAVSGISHPNPIYNNPKEFFHIQQLIYESLVTFDRDRSIIPEIARNWSFSEDGRVLELELNPEVTWHDGEPFTVEDIAFTIDVIQNAPAENTSDQVYHNSIQHISSVQGLENGNVQITFTRPFSNALEALTFPLLPQHLFVEDPELLESEDFPWIGTGAYKLVGNNSEGFSLTKFEEHDRMDPFIENIEVQIEEDYDAKQQLFENGELDLLNIPYLDLEGYEGYNEEQVHNFTSNQLEFLAFNFELDHIVSDNPDIRKIIEAVISKDQVIEDVYFGLATKAKTPISPEHWLYKESLDSEDEALAEEEVQNVLKESGFEFGEDGLWVDENGEPLGFSILVNDNHLPRVLAAELIQEQLRLSGFDVSLEKDSFTNIQQRLEAGDFEVYFGAWELAFLPDLSFAFHSDYTGRSNFMNYINPELDNVLEEAFRAPTQEEKKAHYDTLQRTIAIERPIISLYFLQETYFSSDRLQGKLAPEAYNIFANMEEWFLETK